MAGPIAKVTIQAVRGIRGEVALDLKGSSLVLRGDNGTGKSSIVHALRWALLGEGAPTMDDTDASQSSFYRHVEEKPNAPRVVVTLGKSGGSIEVTPMGVIADEKGRAFRDACCRATPFLRRPDLLRFLEAKPGERFKYLETFLDLELADKVRDSLAGRAKATDETAKGKRHEHDILLAKAAALLPITRKNVSTWDALHAALISWGIELGRTLPTVAPWEALEEHAAEIAPLVQGEALGKRRTELTQLQERLSKLPTPKDPSVSLARVRELERQTSAATLARLLEEAVAVVTGDVGLEACPVCEQSINRYDLLERLRIRKVALDELATARDEIEQLGLAWGQHLRTLDALLDDIDHAATTPDTAPPRIQLPSVIGVSV
jgi:hypothetical protein